MATPAAQHRWRQKNRLVKSQLNVTVRKLVHDDLVEIAVAKSLRGKAEAVSFCSFVTKGLAQYAAHDQEAARLLRLFELAFMRDREIYR